VAELNLTVAPDHDNRKPRPQGIATRDPRRVARQGALPAFLSVAFCLHLMFGHLAEGLSLWPVPV